MKILIDTLKSGKFVLTLHAQERMSEREISFNDIINVGITSQNIIKKINDTFEIDGFDCDGRRLIIICVQHQQTLIITLFRKSRKRK